MLSLSLGKTLAEIEQMPEQHLQEYQLFYQQQPFGLWREDYRTAQISHLLAMIHRNTKTAPPELNEFMPFYQDKKATKNTDDGRSAVFLANRSQSL